MKIIKNRERVTKISYSLDFEWKDCPGAGFSFNCDKGGNIDPNKMNPAARENYEKCISGEYDVICQGVQRREHSYTEPAVGLCNCGNEVYLDGFTNTCEKCGRDYNFSGQELAPRHQWGEETGEHWSDIERIR